MRDRIKKRRDMVTHYLLEAYRRLEMAANREEKTEEQRIAFESAIADIQLLGSQAQISKAIQYVQAQAASSDTATLNELLYLLRNDLRKQLNLPRVKEPLKIFRFVHKRDCGNYREDLMRVRRADFVLPKNDTSS